MLYRVYFNKHGDPARAWSVDLGDQSTEKNYAWVRFSLVIATTKYTGEKANPDYPVAWIEARGHLTEVNDGAVISPEKGRNE
jgi:hypothetical protein